MILDLWSVYKRTEYFYRASEML